MSLENSAVNTFQANMSGSYLASSEKVRERLDQKLLRCLSWPANVWFSLGAGKQQALISICTQEIKGYFVGARAQRTSDFVLELVIYGHFSKMPGNQEIFPDLIGVKQLETADWSEKL